MDGKMSWSAAIRDDSKVLVVATDAKLRDELCNLLANELALAEVVGANGSAEGTDRAGALRPDLMVLAVGPCGAAAVDVCRRMRGALPPDVPIVVVHEPACASDCSELYTSGADALVSISDYRCELVAHSRAFLRMSRSIRVLAERERALAQRVDWIRYLVHDLNNPLTISLAGLQIAGRSLAAGSVDRVPQLLDDARISLEAMAEMLHDLLDIDRFQRGLVRLRKAAFVPVELVREIATSVAPLFEDHGTPVAVEADVRGREIAGDRALIERVLRNLLHNGLRYAPSKTTITVAVENMPTGVRVSVTNLGPPIDPADRERIFQPFVRLDDTGPAGGAGLGLAFARLVVEAHGGAIWVEDPDPGGKAGVRFVLTLPG